MGGSAHLHGLASVAHESESEAWRGASSEGGLFTGLVWRDWLRTFTSGKYLASTDHASLFHTRGPSGKRRRATSGGLDRRHSARMGVGALFAQHAACSAASTRPPHARALGMPAARLPTWPGCAWQAPARHRSGAPEARFARCWLSPRRRFHVSPAQSGAETSRKCASSQLLMDLRREPSTLFNSSAGPARPSGASFKRAV